MDSNFNNENELWEFSLDIDDSDLHLTPVVRSSSSTHVEPSPYTPNPIRIIPDPAGIVSTTNYVTATVGTVTGCLGDIDNNLKKGKLDQVVAIVKFCSPNALDDLTVTIQYITKSLVRGVMENILLYELL
ncbi:hypothetical protein Tco_0687951 [Tanacetum coccineum]